MRLLRLAVASLLLGPVAFAQAPSEETRWAVGARLAYGWPFGQWTGNTSYSTSGQLTEVYSAVFPLQLEAAYRLRPGLFAGLYAQFAPALMQYACIGGSCTARNLRGGAELLWRSSTPERWSPFAVVELGYEVSDFTAQSDDAAFRMDVSYRGLDATFTFGADHAIGEKLRLGFYLYGRVGTYLWLSVRMVREGFEVIPNPSLHGFLGFGARAEYALF